MLKCNAMLMIAATLLYKGMYLHLRVCVCVCVCVCVKRKKGWEWRLSGAVPQLDAIRSSITECINYAEWRSKIATQFPFSSQHAPPLPRHHYSLAKHDLCIGRLDAWPWEPGMVGLSPGELSPCTHPVAPKKWKCDMMGTIACGKQDLVYFIIAFMMRGPMGCRLCQN